MIRFPYGIADFHRIRTQGMVYVDRTAYVREVEALGAALVFLRPRRFGKSLWLQTLANYYDLRRADEFDQLFGDLAIGHPSAGETEGGNHGPTPLRNRYFVLQWNLAEVSARGGVAEIGDRINLYVNDQIVDFVAQYQGHLPGAVPVSEEATNTLRHLLTAIRKTPYKLYLLIDEYDNFINEVMVRDAKTYRSLVETGGPFKELFKSVKTALEGQGLERVFVTGVSPVALNDITSGFNNAKNVSLEPNLAALCGFREKEIRDLVERIGDEGGLSGEAVEDAMATMCTWYNGYRFSHGPPGSRFCGDEDLVYNPTNVLYFLDHLYRWGTPPEQLHDENLRTDRGKLNFLARTATPSPGVPEGAGVSVVQQLTEGNGEINVGRLAISFSLDDLTAQLGSDQDAVASLLYYMGLLTLTDVRDRLRSPNLVVRKLFLDRLLELFLPDLGDGSLARRLAVTFFKDGDLRPLVAFFEDKLLPVLSNRDRGAPPRQPGRSGSGVNEMVIKALFLSILFDDTRYVTSSELELSHGYADLCLLVRPEMRQYGYVDQLFEFKLVRRKELGKKGQELREMDDDTLGELPAVAAALAEARDQIRRYREVLTEQYGEATLNLRCYAVVAVGLERMLGEEVRDRSATP